MGGGSSGYKKRHKTLWYSTIPTRKATVSRAKDCYCLRTLHASLYAFVSDPQANRAAIHYFHAILRISTGHKNDDRRAKRGPETTADIDYTHTSLPQRITVNTPANPPRLRRASDGAVVMRSPSRLWIFCARLSLLVASFECIELCDVTGGLSVKMPHGNLSLER